MNGLQISVAPHVYCRIWYAKIATDTLIYTPFLTEKGLMVYAVQNSSFVEFRFVFSIIINDIFDSFERNIFLLLFLKKIKKHII